MASATYAPNYPSLAPAPAAWLAAGRPGGMWVPGLLELPADEQRRMVLAVRAPWSHIATRLGDRARVESTVRGAVAAIEGTADEVLSDMVLRHLEHVATPAGDLHLHQMAHLLAILMGTERATRLAQAVLGMVEEGIQESWYERKMRRMYGAR